MGKKRMTQPSISVNITKAKTIIEGVTVSVLLQSNLGYPNSFVLRILYPVRISEFVQITEVVAKINRKRLI